MPPILDWMPFGPNGHAGMDPFGQLPILCNLAININFLNNPKLNRNPYATLSQSSLNES